MSSNIYSDTDNQISPYAFVGPNVIMGKNNVIMEGAIVRDGVTMGDNNFVGPYCIIGEVAEKREWLTSVRGCVTIGNNNTFTKQVTVDAGTTTHTTIENDVLMLKNSHVGHDAIIRSNVTLSCNAVVGGGTEVREYTNFGLGAVAHQRLIIPPNCMIGMNSTITKQSIMRPGYKYIGSPIKELGPNV